MRSHGDLYETEEASQFETGSDSEVPQVTYPDVAYLLSTVFKTKITDTSR